jgi:hypothetical protein
MASFTDLPPQFTPYTPQLPVEAMVQVGMAKQAKYEQGVQKIQAQIDQVAGMDVLRDVDKNYLQTKLNELGGNLTMFAAADFSNFQLVNSVGGMTKQIARDNIIQAAVSSTANHRKQKAEMEADKKKGTLTPDNEYKYTKQFSNYASSTDLKDEDGNPIVFSGQYIPHFDVFKFAKETFDAVKPDGFSFDQIYQLGADGKPVQDAKGNLILSPAMTRMEKEGIFPEKVKQTLSQVFSDPRVAQQLQITGEYTYRGETNNTLANKILSQKQTLIEAYDDKLIELTMQQKLGKDVQDEIDKLQTQRQQVASSYDQYANTALSNPDAVRGQLYKDDITSRYTTMFGWTKSSEKVMDNPRWRAEFDKQKEANEQSRFAQTMRFNITQEATKNYWKQKEYEQEERKIAAQASTRKPGQSLRPGDPGYGLGPAAAPPTQGNQSSDIDKLRIFEKENEEAATNFINSSDRFIWETTGLADIDKNIAYKNKLMSQGKTEDEAIHIMINDLAKQTGETPEAWRVRWGDKATVAYNKMSSQEREMRPALSTVYNQYANSRRTYDNSIAIKKQVEEQTARESGYTLADAAKLTEGLPDNMPIIYDGQSMTLTKDDYYDIAVYLRGYKSSLGFLNDEGARQAAKTAYTRLQKRGKSDLADAVLTNERLSTEGMLSAFSKTDPLTKAKALVSAAGTGLYDFGYSIINRGISPGVIESAVIAQKYANQVLAKIDNKEYETGLRTKAAVIDRAYGIRPNLNLQMLTGDSETDKNIVYNLQRTAGQYSTRGGDQINLSPDFKQFAEGLDSDPSKNILSAQVIMDQDGKPQIEIVNYDLDKKTRKGGMTITPEEAALYNINVSAIYEPREIAQLRNYIGYNGGQTSKQNIELASTYISGDAYYDEDSFPSLSNTKYRAKANIKYSGGVYIPYVYITDGTRSTKKARELPPQENLQLAVGLLKQINPTLAENILIGK